MGDATPEETPGEAPGETANDDEAVSENAAEESSADEAGDDAAVTPAATCEAHEQEPLTTEHCTFDDFMKVDMRVARIAQASHVEGADKLLQLVLDLGGDVRKKLTGK